MEEHCFGIFEEEDIEFISIFMKDIKESLPALRNFYTAYLANEAELNIENDEVDDNEELGDSNDEWDGFSISFERDVFKQSMMQLLPDTSHAIITKPFAQMNDNEISIALEHLSQLKKSLTQYDSESSKDFSAQIQTLNALIDEITKKIIAHELSVDEQHNYIMQLNELIEQIKLILSDYIEQQLAEIENELQSESWNIEYDFYSDEEIAEFISSLPLCDYKTQYTENNEHRSLFELIQQLEKYHGI